MRFIDLKSNPFQHHPCASLRKEMADEFRKDGVLSADGFSTFIRVSPLCRSLPGQLQSEELFMLGSVSFSCWDQFPFHAGISFCVWPFAQLTYRESLRDIETCLRA